MRTFAEYVNAIKYTDSALMHKILRSQNPTVDLQSMSRLELNSLMTDFQRALQDQLYDDYHQRITKLVPQINSMLGINNGR